MHITKQNRNGSIVPVSNRGFTLIEVIVAAAIVSIVASVAFPVYQESVRKAKRVEGRAALMQLMHQQERYYSQHGRYIAFSSESRDENAKKFAWYSGSIAATSAYEIAATACQNDAIENCVLLTAKPGTSKVDSSHQDAKCGNLMLTSTGIRSVSSKAADCWQ
jgi:type IV pilus assembly protein PilE